MNELPFELFGEISHFLSTTDFLHLTQTCQKCRKLLFEKHVMIKKEFKLINDCRNTMESFRKLTWKVYNLDLNENKFMTNDDFKLLEGIHTLEMINCCRTRPCQESITDEALFHLVGIQKLNISHCWAFTKKSIPFLKTVPFLTADACSDSLRNALEACGITSKSLCDKDGCYSCGNY